MKSVKILLALVLSVVCVSASLFAASVTVNVKDENGAAVNGAMVAALIFDSQGNPKGPDPKDSTIPSSKIGVTNASGVCTISLSSSTSYIPKPAYTGPYIILVTKQGYSPTIFDQASGASTPIEPVVGSTDTTRNITLRSGLTGVGKVSVALTLRGSFIKPDGTLDGVGASTSSLVLGAVKSQATQEDIAFGIATSTGGKNITLDIYNVSIAAANTYGVGAFWPAANLGNGAIIDSPITDGGTVNKTIDFNAQEAMAVERQQSTQQSPAQTTQSGGAYLKGVVTDEQSKPVANADVSVWGEYRPQQTANTGSGGNRWTRTDSNGVYIFYDFPPSMPGATYYMYFNVNAPGYEGIEYRGTQDAANNYAGGVVYTYPAMIFSFDAANGRALKAAQGEISGFVTIGNPPIPLPNGWVNANGDGTRWASLYNTTTDYFNSNGDNPWEGWKRAGRGWGGAQVNNGKFNITGLPNGNYRLNINSDFSQNNIDFNKGADNNENMSQPDQYGSSTHTITGDDLRITVDSLRNTLQPGGSKFVIYSASGVFVSTYVAVNIPVTAAGGQSATIQGKIKLIGADGIPVNAPITLIARQDWNVVPKGKEITDELVTVSYDGQGNAVALPKYKNIDHQGIVAKKSDNSVTYYDNNPASNRWVQGAEDGVTKIYWNPSYTGRPANGEQIKVSYKIWGGRAKSGFTSISGAGTEFAYYIQVPMLASNRNDGVDESTNTFRIEIKTAKLGIAWSGGDLKADFSTLFPATTVYTLPDLTASPAGSITGIVYKPNGELFKPQRTNTYISMGIDANLINGGSWGWTEVKDDGSFEIGGLLPGTYRLRTRTNYNNNDLNTVKQITWAETKVQGITVSTVAPANVTINLKEGVRVKPVIDITSVLTTEINDYFYSGQSDKHDSGIAIVGFPAGTQLNNQTLPKMLFTEPDVVIGYGADWSNPSVKRWQSDTPIPEGKFDFYLVAKSGWDKGTIFTAFMAEKKNVSVDSALLGQLAASATNQYMNLDVPAPSLGDATITGKITGANIITQNDLPILKNNFDKILEFIPTITLYDSNGRLAGFASNLSKAQAQTQDSDKPFKDAIASGDLNAIKTLWEQAQFFYTIRFLKPGTYTALFFSPNYPPYTKVVTLGSGQTPLDINLDNVAGSGSIITGTISDSANSATKIAGATVVVKTKGYEKSLTTDAGGVFKAEGVGKGIYLVEVRATGYAPMLKKVGVRGGVTEAEKTNTVDIALTQAGETLGGTVYISKYPFAVIPKDSVKIVAFDRTLEATDKKALLPLYSALTDPTSGTYTLPGMITDHVYTLIIITPGSKIDAVTGKIDAQGFQPGTISGGVFTPLSDILYLSKTGIDFILKYLPPAFDVKQLAGNTSIDFTIKTLKTIKNNGNPAVTYSANPYSETSNTAVTIYGSTGTANTWTCSIPISSLDSSLDYIMKVYGEYDGTFKSTAAWVNFGAKIKARVQIALDELQYTGGDVQVDETLTDPSAVSIPAGGIESSNGASGASSLSSFALDEGLLKAKGIKMEAQAASVGGFAMFISKLAKVTAGDPGKASGLITDIYDLSLQNGKVNKDLTLTLAYNSAAYGVTDETKLSIKKYNDATGQWETVEGVTTIANNTISVDISTVASVSGASIQAMAASGTKYAVFYTTSTSPTVNAYNGIDVKVYNFPNPFDLNAKTVTLADAALIQATISGTMIKLSLPFAANNAKVVAGSSYKYEIYNIAGEFVRTIDLGIQVPGTYIYQEWDGKNDGGDKCASGVYLLVIKQGGAKLLDKAVKLAIIK